MKVYDSSVQNIEVSRELEIINFRVLQENQRSNGIKNECSKRWIPDDGKSDGKRRNEVKDQFTTFQRAMRVLFVWGQCLGLNPVTGIMQKDVAKIRFTIRSFKFLFSITTASLQVTALVLCLVHQSKVPASIGSLGYIAFFSATSCMTVFFLRIATKWPTLLKELSHSRLDEYVDPNIIKKCIFACISLMGLALVEYALSIVTRVARMLDCSGNVTSYTQTYMKLASPWLYDLDFPHIEVLGFITQYINLTATVTWNYADIFIVCISLYLTSILQQINKRIALTAKMIYMPPSVWGALREDYTRATRLVRLFDDVISSIIFVTFASDLFFICLQLFNILANGSKSSQMTKACPEYGSGLLRGYEYPIYFSYSSLYLLIRFLCVSLVASSINTASMEAAPILYGIPTTAYNKEVERFLSQVTTDEVALSGLQFFYIKKELVLSVAGTIVTYELVLLQFSNED